MKLALQLYTIRNELARDPSGTLARIQSMGIEAVEIAPLPENLSATRLAQLLQESNLKVAAIHCELPVGDKLHPVLDLAAPFDPAPLIWHGWPRDPAYDTVDTLRRLVERINEAHSNLRPQNLEFGLHNHWWEFELTQGRPAYQILLERLHPDIFFEIDTYWARSAGRDPAAILHELQSRVRYLHLKDGSTIQGQPMCALGEGTLDFPAIFNAAPPTLEWLVVELDECATDIWEAIRRSFDFLHRQHSV